MPHRTVFHPNVLALWLAGLCCLAQSAQGQVNIDSLRTVWNDPSKPDSVRLKAIQRIAWRGFINSNMDSAEHYARLQLAFAEKRGMKREMALAHNTLGGVFEQRGEFEKAIAANMASFKLREELGNTYAMASSLMNIGNVHAHSGNHVEAIRVYRESIKVQQHDRSSELMADVLNNIGNLHCMQGDYGQALSSYRQSLAAHSELGSKPGIAMAMGNMGIMLENLGELDSAMQCHTRSLGLYRELGSKTGEATSLSSMGAVMSRKGRHMEAAQLYLQALQLAEQVGDRMAVAGYASNVAAAYASAGQRDKALPIAKRGYELAKEIGRADVIRDAALNYYELLSGMGRHKEALEAYRLHILMRDSIMREENQRETIRTEFRHEAELKDAEITLLNAENQRKEAEALAERNKRYLTLLGSGGIVLLLAGGGLWLIQSRRQAHRREMELAEHRKKLIENDFLRSKLKTHFVKNAMQSIDGFVQRGRSDLAHEYIGRFNTLMRWILETAGRGTVPLAEELEAMRLYLALEEPVAEHGLTYAVTVDEGIDPEEVMLPPLILQPFVENALFHGLKDTGRQGEVQVRVRREGGSLVCSVEDNGRGISGNGEGRPGSNGLRLVRQRLALFSPEAAMSVSDTGKGTRAEIRLAA